jgi:hypothetical protein
VCFLSSLAFFNQATPPHLIEQLLFGPVYRGGRSLLPTDQDVIPADENHSRLVERLQ